VTEVMDSARHLRRARPIHHITYAPNTLQTYSISPGQRAASSSPPIGSINPTIELNSPSAQYHPRKMNSIERHVYSCIDFPPEPCGYISDHPVAVSELLSRLLDDPLFIS
jgi:hypothetical protein